MLKLNRHIIFLFFIPLLSVNSLCAQKQQIGLSLGVGKTLLDEFEEHTPLSLNDFLRNNNSQYWQLGIDYFFTPQKTMLRINSGIRLSDRIYDYNHQEFKFLSVPIGIDFILGKKLKFIIGMGGYYSYLIDYQVNIFNKLDFDKTKRKFLIGMFWNTGISYPISKIFNLSIIIVNNNDLTPLYSNKYSKGGGISKTKFEQRLFDCLLKVGISYNISK